MFYSLSANYLHNIITMVEEQDVDTIVLPADEPKRCPLYDGDSTYDLILHVRSKRFRVILVGIKFHELTRQQPHDSLGPLDENSTDSNSSACEGGRYDTRSSRHINDGVSRLDLSSFQTTGPANPRHL